MQSPKGYILYKIYYDKHLVYLGRTKQPLINRIKTHCFKDPTVRSIEIDKISKIEVNNRTDYNEIKEYLEEIQENKIINFNDFLFYTITFKEK